MDQLGKRWQIKFTEGISGITKERDGLTQALLAVAEGNNTLVVWKLDRLGRSLGFLCDSAYA